MSKLGALTNLYRLPAWVTNAMWLLVIGVLALVYPILNTPRQTTHHLETAIDNWIPLIPWFVVPYLSWYGLLGLSLWKFLGAGPRILGFAALAVVLDLVFSYTFFYFYQTHIDRPTIVESDIASLVLKSIYQLDEPYNGFPSLHTSLATLTALLWRKVGFPVQTSILVWAILIVASTVMVKQHYLLDIPGGLAIGIISFLIATRFHPYHQISK